MKLQSYIILMRLNNPTGILLLLLPCFWSILLVPNISLIDVSTKLLVFTFGAIIMRSGGCIINDIYDRNLDKLVFRTKDRPLASGDLGIFEAIILLFILLLIGLFILLSLNITTIILGFIFSIGVLLYPLMKRIISIPQLFLAITFNAGALMGSSSILNTVNITSYILYLSCIFWTLGYDTIYSHQDKHDDARIGIKSATLLFGSYSRYIITLCYSTTIFLLFIIGFMNNLSIIYYIGLCIFSVFLLHQIIFVDLDNSSDCMKKFKSNTKTGTILFIALFLESTYGSYFL